MKYEATVHFVVNDEEPGNSYAKYDVSVNRYEIIINPDQKSGDAKPYEILAHELGHVIGDVFKLPRHEKDPRTLVFSKAGPESVRHNLMLQHGMTTHAEDVAELHSEQEAWELGEKMVPISKKTVKESLDTYR